MAHVAILGGGPGGYVAAVRARQLGADVTLVEMDALGGTCLNRGCIPSKALLRSAELIRLAQHLDEFGVEAEFKHVNWPQVIQRKNQVVSHVVKGIEYLMNQNGIRVMEGRGRLADARTIVVDTGGREETITADKVVLATGSVSARLPLPGFDGPGVVTSAELLDIERIPESLTIIGGGYVGVEFADIFSAAGSKVTIIEMLSRIVPTEDEEIAAELARAFRRRGIATHVNARVMEIVEKDGRRLVRFSKDEKEYEVEAEVVLSAVGRWPNTEDVGLQEAGIEMDGRSIKVGVRMETSLPGVYGCGDAVGGIMLAHVASAEGKVAAANALGQQIEMAYSAIPSVIYTHPEIGSTGLTEAQAQAKGVDVKVGKFHFRGSGKATAEGEREGLVKIVVDAASGKILGGQICGPHATDLIHEIVLAVSVGATAQQVGDMVHAHPTLMEPIMEAAEDALGRAIHK
ncbi:MAG: dihydrolipoyl dehydrogenase [Armatimonadota bacterium]|nr:MAG: dihydrolipoyl dehydrogenase [Armatimonadota bacterium]